MVATGRASIAALELFFWPACVLAQCVAAHLAHAMCRGSRDVCWRCSFGSAGVHTLASTCKCNAVGLKRKVRRAMDAAARERGEARPEEKPRRGAEETRRRGESGRSKDRGDAEPRRGKEA